MGAPVRKHAAADHHEMPWANGQGTTWEVARQDGAGGDFDWRISFAAVAGTTTFSSFPGIDRVIVLAAGERLLLDVDGRRHELLPGAPFAFAGEAAVTCVAPAPTVDFNVMTRRGRVEASVDSLMIAGGQQVELPPVGDDDVLLVAGLEGELTAHGYDGATVVLTSRDVARGPVASLTGEGRAIVVVLRDLRA